MSKTADDFLRAHTSLPAKAEGIRQQLTKAHRPAEPAAAPPPPPSGASSTKGADIREAVQQVRKAVVQRHTVAVSDTAPKPEAPSPAGKFTREERAAIALARYSQS